MQIKGVLEDIIFIGDPKSFTGDPNIPSDNPTCFHWRPLKFQNKYNGLLKNVKLLFFWKAN